LGISSAAALTINKFLKPQKERKMAKINNNLLVRGARGHMGKQFVYRQRGEDTFMARMPVIKKGEPTDKQEIVRDLFGEASAYAQGVITDLALKKQYQKKANPGRTAFNIAFRDYLKAPVVKSINVDRYNGTPASTIVVKAKDDFRVAGVSISIRTAAGVLVEEGNAILNPINRNQWIYTSTQNNAALAGTVIHAVARDLPGNEGVLEKTIPSGVPEL
jgi:hypothetical protein